MQEEQPAAGKVSLQRKLIIGAALTAVLIVIPGMSWYYLSTGLEWRKKAKAELRDFGKIREAFVIYPDKTRVDVLDSKVCVLYFFGEEPDLTETNKKVLDDFEKLWDQFGTKGDNDNLRVVMIHQGGTAEFLTYAQTKPNYDYWIKTGGLGGWTTILINGYDAFCQSEGISPDKSYYCLADTSGTMRRFYNTTSTAEVERMVQHIGLILPR
jgi:hypothetical protein